MLDGPQIAVGIVDMAESGCWFFQQLREVIFLGIGVQYLRVGGCLESCRNAYSWARRRLYVVTTMISLPWYLYVHRCTFCLTVVILILAYNFWCHCKIYCTNRLHGPVVRNVYICCEAVNCPVPRCLLFCAWKIQSVNYIKNCDRKWTACWFINFFAHFFVFFLSRKYFCAGRSWVDEYTAFTKCEVVRVYRV